MKPISAIVIKGPYGARVPAEKVLDASWRGQVPKAATELSHLQARKKIHQAPSTLSKEKVRTFMDHARVARGAPLAVIAKLKSRVLQLSDAST